MMPGFAEVPPGGPSEGLPPSFAQQRLWFLDQLAPGDPSSHLAFARRLSGALDVSASRDAFTEVVSRREALRTRVVTTVGRPRQVIDPASAVAVAVQDVSSVADDHVLVMAVHHIAADEWSMGILESELSVLYRAFADGQPSPLAPLDIQYAEFLACRSVLLQAITNLLLPVMSVPRYAGPVTNSMIEVMILSGKASDAKEGNSR